MGADKLFALVASVRNEEDRRVRTPLGCGYLWQVFRDRAGVVLDSRPGWVQFLDPELVAPEGR